MVINEKPELISKLFTDGGLILFSFGLHVSTVFDAIDKKLLRLDTTGQVFFSSSTFIVNLILSYLWASGVTQLLLQGHLTKAFEGYMAIFTIGAFIVSICYCLPTRFAILSK